MSAVNLEGAAHLIRFLRLDVGVQTAVGTAVFAVEWRLVVHASGKAEKHVVFPVGLVVEAESRTGEKFVVVAPVLSSHACQQREFVFSDAEIPTALYVSRQTSVVKIVLRAGEILEHRRVWLICGIAWNVGSVGDGVVGRVDKHPLANAVGDALILRLGAEIPAPSRSEVGAFDFGIGDVGC